MDSPPSHDPSRDGRIRGATPRLFRAAEPAAPHPFSPRPGWWLAEVQPHCAALRSYLRGAFPEVRDVEDVVQESLLRVWRAHLGEQIRFSKSFLFQVARRIALDLVRRRRVSPEISGAETLALEVADERPGGVEAACRSDEIALLVRAFASMPSRCREVVFLRKIEGLSHREIAARLRISECAVEQHVVRGARRIERYFARHGVVPRSP